MARSTREAILTAAVELMRSKGYGAVGMKDIVAASGAPIGSLYHHFDSKVQIARAALINAGAAYALLIPSIADDHTDLGQAIDAIFSQAADDMQTSGFVNMCPVGSVAAEVADTVEPLREACAAVFAGWFDAGTSYFVGRGLSAEDAREVTVALVGALEGAFVLARTLRDTEPLRSAGRVLGPRYRGIALSGLSPRVLPTAVGPAR
jgi:AcrR family transcriptional regulator